MPLFNEEDGIESTLQDLDRELHRLEVKCFYFIQNDCSTDLSLQILKRLEPALLGSLEIESNNTNLRHGPTTRRAYVRAAKSECEIIIQLDSDGQFDPSEIATMLNLFISTKSADLLIGARRNRTDPWFRKIITGGLRLLILLRFGFNSPDPNSPIRFVRKQTLRPMIDCLPLNVFTPNILLTILYHKRYKNIFYIPINHTVRRGVSKTGTMWTQPRFKLMIPRSLLKLCFAATKQVVFSRIKS